MKTYEELQYECRKKHAELCVVEAEIVGLEAAIKRAYKRQGDIRIEYADLNNAMDKARHPAAKGNYTPLAGTTLEQIEKRAIVETLDLTGGNREKAAELLGIGERTLYRKLISYDIQ